MRKPTGCSCSSARCASRLAVRARIGTALTVAAVKPRSSMTAAIGIETFSVSGRPHACAAASRNACASAPRGGEVEDALGPRIERLVERVAEARELAAALPDRLGEIERDGGRVLPRVDARTRLREQSGALVGRAEDHRPAAEDARGDRAL